MKNYTKSLSAACTAILVTLGASSAVAAAPSTTVCSGTLSHRALDDVTVADGTTCTVMASTVHGSITVHGSGALTLDQTQVEGMVATVDGDPFTNHPMSIRRSVVNGHIHSGWAAAIIENSVTHDVGSQYPNITDSVVRGNLIAGGFFGGANITRSRITGSLQASGVNARLDASTVVGSTDLEADGVFVCGSDVTRLTVHASYRLRLGDGAACAGNRINRELTVETIPLDDTHVFNNTVRGRTVSPAGPLPSGREEFVVEGSGNHFLGGVKGYLSALK